MSTTSLKRVAIIGTNGLPASYGGFETLVENIHEKIAAKHDLVVYCSNKTPKGIKNIGDTKLIRFPLSANGWQSFIYDFISIFHALFNSDVIIILGLGGGLAIPLLRLINKKIIYNPGGVESDKIRGARITQRIETRIKKKFNEGFAKYSDYIILDNKAFFDSYNIYSQKLKLIEYGGENINEEEIEPWKGLFQNYDISISRAQKDMNIHIVLEAYTMLDRNLVLVSNWKTSEYGRKLWEKYYNKFSNIQLHEAVYDKSKLNSMRKGASLYIHSHMLCGTAPSLVEAMSLNLGAICFDVETNRNTTENKAIYFTNVQDLHEKLKIISKEEIKHNKAVMKEIAERRYNWQIISEKYLCLI